MSALSVSSERCTASCQRPSYVHCAAQSSQNVTVARERLLGLDRLGRSLVGREPAQNERDAVAFGDGERRDGAEVATLVLDRSAQEHCVWAGDREQRSVERAHPRDDRAVVEADDELHLHLDAPADAFDDPDEVGVGLPRRHEVDQPHGSVVRLELGLEDERVASVLPARGAELTGGLDRPVAVLLVSEKCREQRARVEAGEAQPVDRALAAHERGALRGLR